uniref:Prolyl 4-hydroxylase alpha subunit n=1 Tax=Cyanothece sp. (strain PCC 7425 / ATCC 29141) TaxID=395961 RepID=B8HQ53_CYAP4
MNHSPSLSVNPTSVGEVKATLLLMGGHSYTLYLQSDSALLQQLLSTMLDRLQVERSESKLFQIPLEGERSLLTFTSEALIGIVTEPPMYLQFAPANLPAPPASEPVADSVESSAILLSNYVRLEQFLTPEELSYLIEYVVQQKDNFAPTHTSTGDLDYRKSLILYNFPEFSQLVVNRIRTVMPEVLTKLKMPPFSVGEIESQLTAHGDGNYYKIHNDNGSPETATRELTYVYYFYQQPKCFSGGELRLFDSKIENGFYVAADSSHIVEPDNNSIIFFPSRYLHEVLPVQCPSREFQYYRFTINGWIRRA